MPRLTARLVLLLATIAAIVVAALAADPFVESALAQATGGSFGGGSWGGGGGGGRSDYGGGGYSGGGYSGGGGDGSGLIALVFLAFRINPIFGLLVLGVVVVAVIARGAAGNFGGGSSSPTRWNQPVVNYQPQAISAAPSGSARAWMNADVTKVRIALALPARASIEGELTHLWSTTNVGMKGGLLRVVHRTVQLLRANEALWRFAGESNFHPMSPPQAESMFRQLSDTARQKRGAAIKPSGDPESVFLVTVIVAARREIVDFQANRPEQIRMVLDDLLRLSEMDLVAAEISWLPLEQGAGMSAADLSRVHPDMRAVEQGGPTAVKMISGAAHAQAAGRVFCPWCGKDYARQHPQCVHCGGPRPEGT